MSQGPTPTPGPTPPTPAPYRRSRYCSCARCRCRGFMGPVVLITLGALFLLGEYVPGVDFGDLWPILLIAIGVVKLLESTASTEGHQA